MQALPLAYRQVHLDFHTSEQIPGIGSRFDAAQFVATLQRAEVNSITCFSKCHHGMIYHDTRFAARHPHLEVNLLREQIEACHAAGIRVPIYISVGLDEFMAARHPEWVELGVDGKRRGAAPLQAGWKKLCFNTPYMDYVWEQTQEVLELFEVDGLFFDIINQGQCCCRWCMARMAEEGVNPESEPERKQFARRILDEMKLDFTARIRERNAGCNVFWNSGHVDPSFRPVLGAYSHLELESLPSGGWGYDHFLLTVRYARNLGLDHVGMTGKFHKTWAGFGEFKNQAALEYECFTALAEGSKCSIGDQLPPSGELDPGTYELIGKVYSQVSRVEAWCEGAVPVTELAIFNPEALGVHDGRVDTAAGGAYRMLLEGHHQFDVVDGDMDWSRYRVLILPDKIRLDAVLLAKVRAYLAAGGKVVASHRAGMAPDRDEFVLTELGVRYLQESRFSPDYLTPSPAIAGGILPGQHVMYERGIEVEPVAVGGALPETLAEVWHPYFDRTYAHFCSHRHTPVEKAAGLPGALATANTLYFPHPLFASFMRHGLRVYKQLFLNALNRWLPDPILQTDAPTTAHLTVTRQPGRTLVHILHYVPEQRYRETPTIEDTLPLHDVGISLRADREPRQVTTGPDGAVLSHEWRNGRVEFRVPRVIGYGIVEVQDAAP